MPGDSPSGRAGRLAQEPERVGAHAAGRRGERAEQGLVVERVGDHAEQPQHVLDLLLGPVAAPADDVGSQAGSLERLLVGVDVGEGAQQHDHLAARHAGVGQLAQALGQEAGLGDAAGLPSESGGLSSMPRLQPVGCPGLVVDASVSRSSTRAPSRAGSSPASPASSGSKPRSSAAPAS